MRFRYPHTIDNGCGERLTFLGRTVRNGVEYLQVENNVSPSSGPPMHVHYLQDESLIVLEGRLGYEIAGEEPKYLSPGEGAAFSRGTAHRFWNAGNTPLRCSGEIWPPNNAEYFLTEIYRSVREGGTGRPAAFDAA